LDEKRTITPKWVMGFTSKLQGRKILTCCKFLRSKINSHWMVLFQKCVGGSALRSFFFNFNTFCVIFQKLSEINVNFRSQKFAACQDLPTLQSWSKTHYPFWSRLLWEFPIGSYVKLSSAVAAILVGVLKCRTQFWKRTTQ
jgi:hypothetical protein